jgi:CrcB protein
MSLLAWVGVGVAGGCGAVLRVLLTQAGGGAVRGTAIVNVAGAGLLGLLSGLGADSDLLFVLGVGGLGAFTTFSTWMAEAHERRSALVLLTPLALGLLAAALGRVIGAAL